MRKEVAEISTWIYLHLNLLALGEPSCLHLLLHGQKEYTMPPYIYPLPTTSLLTFSNVFIDPTSSHTTVLADATSARTRLHLALKATAGNEPGSSALAVIEVHISHEDRTLTVGYTVLPAVPSRHHQRRRRR